MSREHAYELLIRCASGRDEANWEELVRRYGAQLCCAVQRALARAGAHRGPEQVEELVQETYYRLLERDGRRLRACRGRTCGEVAAYLGRVAESTVADYLRHWATAKRSCPANGTHNAALLPGPLPATPASPEDYALSREGFRHLVERCRQVSGSHSRRNVAILMLSWLEGWTSREISAALAGRLTTSSIDSLLYRVRRRLRAEGGEASAASA